MDRIYYILIEIYVSDTVARSVYRSSPPSASLSRQTRVCVCGGV